VNVHRRTQELLAERGSDTARRDLLVGGVLSVAVSGGVGATLHPLAGVLLWFLCVLGLAVLTSWRHVRRWRAAHQQAVREAQAQGQGPSPYVCEIEPISPTEADPPAPIGD
jgi:cytochrome c-type biogenesis protein CcmH/NrfG